MKKITLFVMALLSVFVINLSDASFAKDSQKDASTTTEVKGYTKKDGTQVKGYTRTKNAKADSDTQQVSGYTRKDGTKVAGYTRKKATKSTK